MQVVDVEIVALFASPLHAYEGRPADGPLPDPDGGAREVLELRAGRGILGDRYCDRPAHRAASVTVIAAESLDAVAAELGVAAFDPLLTRRNVVLRGADVDALAATRDRPGALFALDSGDGPVRLQAGRPAHPCGWMDTVIAPGAFRALRRRGDGGAARGGRGDGGAARGGRGDGGAARGGRGGVRCAPLDDGVLRRGPAVLTVAGR